MEVKGDGGKVDWVSWTEWKTGTRQERTDGLRRDESAGVL